MLFGVNLNDVPPAWQNEALACRDLALKLATRRTVRLAQRKQKWVKHLNGQAHSQTLHSAGQHDKRNPCRHTYRIVGEHITRSLLGACHGG
jgi:hypothetical protein